MAETTAGIQSCVDRIRQGDTSVRGELLEYASERLLRMTRKMKRDFNRVARWEQTEDVFQNALLRLYEALHEVEVADVRHFYRLAAMQIRRELIDMCRHYHGPQGLGANHVTQVQKVAVDRTEQPPLYDRAEVTEDPRQMLEWADFHATVQELPEREREVVDLLWYHELTQDEAASMLGITTRHVKRLWRSAKLLLHERLEGEAPSM